MQKYVKNKNRKVNSAFLFIAMAVGVIISWGEQIRPSFAQSINQIPVAISIFGADNKTISSGEYEVRFALYRVDRSVADPYPSNTDAGNKIWEEVQTVKVEQGILRASLGSVTPFGGVNFESGDYYLGVRIGTDSEMVPRKKLGAVPAAINAQYLRGKTYGTNAGDLVTLDTRGKISIKQLPVGAGNNQLVRGDDSRLKDIHQQNTDTGTDSTIFTIGTSDASTSGNFDLSVSSAGTPPSLRYNGSTQTWQFSNDGSTFSNISNGTIGSVTLGTDTDGDYVESITNGSGLTGGDGGSESAALTLGIDLLDSADGTGSTSSNSGLEFAGSGSNELTLLQGCANGQGLAWNDTTGVWECTSFSAGLSGSGTSGYATYWSGTSSLGSEQYLNTVRGGTGLDASAASNGSLLIGNGSGFTLNTLTAGNGVTITNGVGLVTVGLDVTTTGTTVNTSSNSGLEVTASGLRLLGGCSNDQVLAWSSGSSAWVCSNKSGGTSDWTSTGSLTYLTDTADDLVIGGSAVDEGFFFDVSAGTLSFEGATADGFETSIAVTDPTADRTITLPNVTGTVITSGNLTDITATGTITSGTWNGSTIGIAYGGTGATSLNNLISLGAHTTGNYVASLANGNGITGGAAGSEGATLTLAIDLLDSADGTGSTSSNSGLEFAGTGSNELSLLQGCADNEILSWNDGTNVWQCATVSGVGGISGTGTAGQVAYWTGTSSLSSEAQLAVSRGGTGIGSYTIGDLIYASGATTLAKLADVATGNVLISGGVGVAPSWGKVNLTTAVSGILPVANGGTGASSLTDLITLGTHTTGNYVQSITNGNGISGGDGGSESAALTLALGTLTADWNQTGAFDIVLGNAAAELRILESTGGTFYGSFDVGDLSADQTYTFTTGGTVWTSGNDGSGSGLDADLLDGLSSAAFVQTGATLFTAAATSGSSQSIAYGDTLTIAAGSGITTTASATDTITIAATLGTSVDLTAEVTGLLPVGNGGTGTGSLTSNGVIYGNGTSALGATAAGTNGQFLVGVTSSAPTFVTMSGDATIANDGTLTIAANSVALTTDTTGNYVASLANGNGITGGAAGSEGATLTLAIDLLDSADGTGSTSSNSGLEFQGASSNELTLLQGCANNDVLAWVDATNSWTCTSVGGVGAGDITAIGDVVSGDAFTASGTQGTSLYFYDADGRGQLTIADLSAARTYTLPNVSGTIITTGDTGTVTGAIIADNTIEEVDLETTNSPTDGYILAYDNASGGFTWISNTGGTGSSKWTDSGTLTYLTDTTDDVAIGGTTATASKFFFDVTTGNQIVFEGTGADDANETTLVITNPTADRTITLPNLDGTVILSGHTFTGDVTATLGSGGTTALTIAADSVTLGTDTTGNYVAGATSSGGLVMTGTEGGTLGILLPSATDALSSTTSSASGLEILSSGLTLLQGCSDNQVLSWDETADTWGCDSISGVGGVTGSGTNGYVAYWTSASTIAAEAQLATSRGGTGVDGSAAANGTLLIGNGSGYSLTTLTDGTGITIAEGAGSITVSVTSSVPTSVVNDTNVTGSISANALTLGWTGQLAVSRGGTGTGSLTSNGVIYGNGTSALGATAAGTNGQFLVGVTSSAPTFVTMSGDATIANDGTLTIAANSVALTTDTTGNYVASLANGNGITGGAAGSEGATLTLAIDLLDSADGTGSTSSNSGLEFAGTGSNELSLLQGCADNEILSWNDGTNVWQCATVSGVGGISGTGTAGQVAYWTGTSSLSSEAQLAVSRGGTGIGSYTIGDLIYASGATTLAKLADVATGNVLISGGVGVAPSWGKVNLTTAVSGILPVANGGTGASSLTDLITLGTHTTGNYVQSITNGNGISGGDGGSESAALTLALGTLTADWNQTGAFDISLNNASSELQILESAGATFFGILDAGDLSANRTLTMPDVSGTIATTNGGQTFTSATWNASTVAVAYGGTGATTLTPNGVLYGNGTGAVQATAAGTTGQILVANGSGTPVFVTVGTDATINASGSLVIASDAVALGTDTTGNYVSSITTGNGIAGTASSEGSTPTLDIDLLDTDDSTGSIASNSGLEFAGSGNDELTLLQGCSDLDVLSWDNTTNEWECASVSGVGGLTGSGSNGQVTYWTGTNTLAGENQLNVSRGGTGVDGSAAANGSLLIGNGSGYSLATLASSGASIVITNGAGTINLESSLGTSVDLTSEVTGLLPIANGGTGANSLNNLIALGTHTTGNYVANVATSVLTGLTGGSAGSEGASLTLALDYSQALTGDVGLSANAGVFGQSGFAFEGATADTIETFLVITDPTSSDKTITFPDASGTVLLSGGTLFTLAGTSGSNQTISQGDTVTIAAGTGITTTGGSTDTVTIAVASTVPTSVVNDTNVTGSISANALTLGWTGQLAVSRGGTGTGSLTSNGVIYGNGTSALGATAAGTNGQFLVGVTSSAPTFVTMSGDATINNTGTLTISADAVALGTDTTGNYVAGATANGGLTLTGTEGGTLGILLPSATDGLSSTTSSGSGLELLSSGLTLIQGCGNDQVLAWNETADAWQCSDKTGGTSNFTDAGTVTYLTSTTDDFALGGTGVDASAFFFDVSTSALQFEGATADAFETTFSITDATADNTITFADASGTVILSGHTFTGDVTATLDTDGSTALSIAADSVALGTDTTGNYVANVATSVLTGLTGGSAGSEGASLSIGLDYSATLAADPALSAGATVFSTTGLIFEGATADTSETLLTVADPTADRTLTLPNATGTLISTGNLTDITATGTITSGTWNGTAIGAQYGGTGINGASAANGTLLIGNGSGYTLATLTDGTGITITEGAGSITVAATLGTDIDSAEIVNDAIKEVDLDLDTHATAGEDGYLLAYNNSTGGFSWISPGTAGVNYFTDGGTTTYLTSTTDDFALGGTGVDASAFFFDVSTSALQFEGATADAFETTFSITDATADNTITFADASGTVILSGHTFTGDVTATLDTDGSTALSIAADSVALGTDTTGNYVSSATASGGLVMTGTEGGSLGILLQPSGDALSTTTSSGSGLELLATGVTLLQGCANGEVLKWNETTDVWECGAAGATYSAGSGLTLASTTFKLGGTLTEDATLAGAFDLILNDASSELKILESAGATYYGILDVGDLSADRTLTFPNVSGTIATVDGGQTFTSATWNGTAIGAQYGGTGLDTSASTGVATVSSGTWSIASSLGVSLGGTNATSVGSAGSIAYSNGSAYAFSAVGTAGQALVSGGTGAPTFFAPTAGSIIFAGTSGVLSQDNANFFWDDSNNRLGIGTTSPLAPLDIFGTGNGLRLSYDGSNYNTLSTTSSGTLSITSSNTTQAQLLLGNNSAQDVSVAFDSDTNDFYAGVDDTLDVFMIGAGATIGTTPYVTINGSGNVGIGDTSPAALLTVGSGDAFQINSSGAIAAATGITSSGTITFSGIANDGAEATALLINGSNQVVYRELGTNAFTSGGFATTALDNLAAVAINTSLLPGTDDSIDLGDDTHRWRDLYLGGETIHLGTSTTDEATFGYNTTTNVLNIGTDSTTNGDIAFFTDDLYLDKSAGFVGIGTATPNNPLELLSTTTPQLRLAYNGSNYFTAATNSLGYVTLDAVGTVPGFTFNDEVAIYGDSNTNTTGLYVSRSLSDSSSNDYYGIQNTYSHSGATSSGFQDNVVDYTILSRTGATGGTIRSYGNLIEVTGTGASGSPNILNYGTSISVTGDAIGTSSNAGLFISSISGADTNYGIYLNSPSSAAANYALYSAATAQSYFAGNVGIGDTSPASLFTVGSGDLFEINSSGAITDVRGITNTGAITSTGGTINLNVSSNNAVNIGTGTTTSTVTIGGGSNAFALDSTTIDISAGAITGATGITSSGTITFSGISNDGAEATALLINGSNQLVYRELGSNAFTSGGFATTALDNLAAVAINTSLLPGTDDSIDLGDDTHRWRDLYLGGETIHLGTSTTDEATFGYNTATNVLNIGTDATTNGDIAFFTDDLYLDKSAGFVGIGTATPTTLFEIYGAGTADAIATITAPDATYDPLLKLRTGSSPAVQFTIGVDNSDSDKFKIYSGDGLGSGDEFVIDASGTTTISNLVVGAQSFEADAGAISWIDMSVTSGAADNTVESYTAMLDGNAMLTIYGLSDGAGSVDTLGVGIMDSTPDATLDVDFTRTSGSVFGIAAPSAVTLAGTLTGQSIDLSTNVTATGFSVTGSSVTLPTVTNTGSGTYNYQGLTVTGGAITQTTASGTNNFNGIAVTNPNLTQTTGTLTANGLSVTTGSITTGGTQRGLNIAATGVGAGTLTGVNLSAITGGAGTEQAIVVGSGWDAGLVVNGVTVVDGSGAIPAAAIGADVLDFTEFEDTLDLDAALTLNQTTNTWSQTFTGTTTTGLTYTANSLTSGKALSVESTATALTGALQNITLTGSNASNTGNLLLIADTGASNATTPLKVTAAGGASQTAVLFENTGSGTSFRVNDSASDSTPFLIDAAGLVGIGTTTPAVMLDIYGTSNALRLSYDGSNYATLSTASDGTLSLSSTNTSESQFVIGTGASTDTSIGFDGASVDYFAGLDHTSGSFLIGSGFTVQTGSAFLNITSGGLVGINMTPTARFDITHASTSTTGATEYSLRNTFSDTGIVTTGTDTTYGDYTSLTRTGATGGTINSYGSYITATGDTGGTSTLYGQYITATGADTTYGIASAVTAVTSATSYGGSFTLTDSTTGANTNYAADFSTTDTGVVTTGTDTTYGTRTTVSRTGATGGTLNTYGQYTSLTSTFASGSGTANGYGSYITAIGGTNGTNTLYGQYVTATGADTTYGTYATITGTTSATSYGTAANLTDATTGANTNYGDNISLSDTGVVTTGTDINYGSNIAVTRTSATGGTIYTYGLNLSVTTDNAGSGTSVAHGINIDTGTIGSTNADTVYGLKIATEANSSTTAYGLYVDAGTQAGTEYAAAFLNGNVGIGTATPVTAFELYGSGTADVIATITSPDATYDPLLKLRTGATPAVQFTLGIDNTDSGKFKIYSGDGLSSGDEFVIDSNGVTTIANLNLGATSFDENAGAVSWIDMSVTSSATSGTVESYSALVDGTSFLTIYAESDGSGGLTTTASVVKADVQLDASADGLVTKVNAGACDDTTFTRDTNGLLCVDSTNGRMYFRYGGAWHYTAQTAGFQIPNYETAPRKKLDGDAKDAQDEALPFDSSNYPEYLTDRMQPGEFLIPYVDEYLPDGAVHGLYARFTDVKKNLFGEEQQQIADIKLQTDANAGTLAELQISVDEQLSIVGTSLTDLTAKNAEFDTRFGNDLARLDTLDTTVANLATDVNTQAVNVAALQSEVTTLKDQVTTLTEFFTTFNLDGILTKDLEGNVDLLGGKLKARLVETGGLVIENVDEEAPTIGQAKIYPAAVDANADGLDDVTGDDMTLPEVQERDGRTVSVMTRAMVPMVKGSRIFTSFLDNPNAFSWIEKIVTEEGEYVGFKIHLSEEITTVTKVDWWLVEQR